MFAGIAALGLTACNDRGVGAGEPRTDRIADAPALAPSSASTTVQLDSGAPKLEPVDQADSSFKQFRNHTIAALQRRDTAYLYSILAPAIKNSFGGDDSIAGFKRIWKMSQPDSSLVWQSLTRVLTLGGRMQGEYFTAPYVYAAWPDSLDAFEHIAVTGMNVPAYDRPDVNAPVAGTLSHSILKLEEWQGQDDNGTPRPGSFARVQLPDGHSVWVSGTQVYSPIGWRAFFEKREGRWVMTILVAGD